MNKALALGTEDYLLVTYLVSRNELECGTDSENVTHVYLVSFLLAMGCSRVQWTHSRGGTVGGQLWLLRSARTPSAQSDQILS